MPVVLSTIKATYVGKEIRHKSMVFLENGLKIDPVLPISPIENTIQTRPSPKSWGRKVKSLDMSNYRLERNSNSSSSSLDSLYTTMICEVRQ